VSGNVQPEALATGRRDEELVRLFQSLFETTCTAHGQASEGDFSGIREYLQQRRWILDRVHELIPDEGTDVPLINTELKHQLRTMMQSTQEKNLQILRLICERKKSVLSKIVEVQNRRHVFDYLR